MIKSHRCPAASVVSMYQVLTFIVTRCHATVPRAPRWHKNRSACWAMCEHLTEPACQLLESRPLGADCCMSSFLPRPSYAAVGNLPSFSPGRLHDIAWLSEAAMIHELASFVLLRSLPFLDCNIHRLQKFISGCVGSCTGPPLASSS